MLPFNCPWSIKETLITESVKHWNELAKAAFDRAQELLHNKYTSLATSQFAQYSFGGLEDAAA
jgi:hypothetical protein